MMFSMNSYTCQVRSVLLIERFVVLMYDQTSECMEVNDTRKQLFTLKCKTLDNIPRPQAVFKQHIKQLLPGQLLEPGIGIASRDARGVWVGLDKGNNWVGAALNHSPWSIKIVLWINPLSLQGSVHWTLQVAQSCIQVHCNVLPL